MGPVPLTARGLAQNITIVKMLNTLRGILFAVIGDVYTHHFQLKVEKFECLLAVHLHDNGIVGTMQTFENGFQGAHF